MEDERREPPPHAEEEKENMKMAGNYPDWPPNYDSN